MFDLKEVELEISRWLQPIRDRLSGKGVAIAFLPQSASEYSEKQQGIVRLVLPRIVAAPLNTLVVPEIEKGEQINVSQEAKVTCLIRLSLSKRYHTEDSQEEALGLLARILIERLIGFMPVESGIARSPLYLVDYEMLQPTENYWNANLLFEFKARIDSITPLEPAFIESVELFALRSLTLEENEATSIKKWQS